MVPPVALQVTAVLAAPVTVAVNCQAPPVNRVTLSGTIVTATMGAAMVMAADADLEGSCTLVAITVKEPVLDPAV